MDELIKQIEDQMSDTNLPNDLQHFATALEHLERVRLMRRIVENGIEIEGHMGGRTQIRIVAPE